MITCRRLKTQDQAKPQIQMVKALSRLNVQHVGAQNRSFGCMAMVNVRIVVQMLCRVVMGLCVMSYNSIFFFTGERQLGVSQISAFYLYENKKAL